MSENYKPRILDLFCGAGGAAAGYHRAGFEVVGVDNNPQPRYPFEFVHADAFDYTLAHWHEFDAIHASPPCQLYAATAHLPQCQDRDYPDLIEPVRLMLQLTGLPYIIENVVGAPINGVTLCGLMFGLKVFRHRLFESNILLLQPSHIPHGDRRIGMDGYCTVAGHGDAARGRIDTYHRRKATWQAAIDIDWMAKYEMTQAIPPAYTEYLGRQLVRAIKPRKLTADDFPIFDDWLPVKSREILRVSPGGDEHRRAQKKAYKKLGAIRQQHEGRGIKGYWIEVNTVTKTSKNGIKDYKYWRLRWREEGKKKSKQLCRVG